MDSLSVYAQADANLTEEEKFTNASSIFSMDMQTSTCVCVSEFWDVCFSVKYLWGF